MRGQVTTSNFLRVATHHNFPITTRAVRLSTACFSIKKIQQSGKNKQLENQTLVQMAYLKTSKNSEEGSILNLLP